MNDEREPWTFLRENQPEESLTPTSELHNSSVAATALDNAIQDTSSTHSGPSRLADTVSRVSDDTEDEQVYVEAENQPVEHNKKDLYAVLALLKMASNWPKVPWTKGDDILWSAAFDRGHEGVFMLTTVESLMRMGCQSSVISSRLFLFDDEGLNKPILVAVSGMLWRIDPRRGSAHENGSLETFVLDQHTGYTYIRPESLKSLATTTGCQGRGGSFTDDEWKSLIRLNEQIPCSPTTTTLSGVRDDNRSLLSCFGLSSFTQTFHLRYTESGTLLRIELNSPPYSPLTTRSSSSQSPLPLSPN